MATVLPASLHLSAVPDFDGVVTLQMKNAPVNALSSSFMESLCIAADQLARDDEVKAVILTSGLDRAVFSGGLNLAELIVKEDHPEDTIDPALVQFISHVASVTRAWLAFPKPMIAAINGASPAGGCMLALTADYRVMQAGEKHVIGLNETQVGVQAPWWLAGLLQDAVGVRRAERMLQLGELVGPEEALSIGLVDEVCEGREATHDRAVQAAARFAAVPDHARQATKMGLRRALVAAMEDQARSDAVDFAAHVQEPEVQAQLRKVVARMRKA